MAKCKSNDILTACFGNLLTVSHSFAKMQDSESQRALH